ncbi:MAG: NAD-glutamate dehydrogenase [Proteobacteria bacterium]|nr:NAD-glutamate dehydrogenase [Pseudomonadota bacterium]
MQTPSAVQPNPLLRGIPAARVALIRGIVRAGRGSHGLLPRLLRAYYRGVADEELAARAPQWLARVAAAHLKFAQRRPGQRPLVRVFNPTQRTDGFESARTLVFTVTDDMPFLVDSLGMTLVRAGLAVHMIVHPVLQVRRNEAGRLRDVAATAANGGAAAGEHHAESWQLYEIDRIDDPAQLERVQSDLASTLADVHAAVGDWQAMRERVRQIIAGLQEHAPPLPAPDIQEAVHLLQWMEERHFVFLGYRHYVLRRGRSEDHLLPQARSGLGVLRSQRGLARHVTTLRGDVRTRARAPELLILTKANSTATVHRGEYLDYVGVKTFDTRGRVDGEHRFLGLWTSTAYHGSPRDIPVLRRKVEQVIAHFGLDPASHDGKAVLNVLETYPRDELFQASVNDLIRIARGVVNLYERHNVRLLVRRDPYHRFYSCLVYVPRDRYNTDVRHRIEQIARAGFHGDAVESHAQISSANHARLHVVVRTSDEQPQRPDYGAIERRMAEATRTWDDRLAAVLIQQHGETEGRALAARYRHAFPLAYQEDVPPAEVPEDLTDLEQLRARPEALQLNLHRPATQRLQRVHLKIVKLGEPVPISDVLPMLENFGLRVISERPYEIAWPAGGSAWIQDFELEHRDGLIADIAHSEERFRAAFAATWSGELENDGFNRLVLGADLTGRQIVVLRACCRYLLQTGVPFSQSSMERTLAANTAIARNLVRLFETQFDPAADPGATRGAAARERRCQSIATEIRRALHGVTSLDDDRILRAYLSLLQATLRTNFYQRGGDGAVKAYLSFKLDPARIPDLPLPRPKFEIFVYSPRVEGVHLRMGYVARGGLRWSDRREDFRTEVLGLMKAQNVKNTLIVPVGAKGGFVPKRLPAGTREEIQAEVIACYQTFIRGLLDLTDNIVAGRIVPPPQLLRRDGDDTYLVVAADKGTATFSDIANAIAAEYGFWLGDAFASGGSAGYDHKKMAITARGGWECVKRHFRELGVDTQKTAFTVAGIGDMSGDVFGNGMLLSHHIRLQAAFDHRHVFLDPDPDAAQSFAERARLAALARSSWDDYDRRRISRGGGVWPRSAKAIPLSAEARALLGLEAASAAPTEVIRAILRLPVDLLWNGGIGTYVKASDERNAEVGDRSNDAVRINGRELKARVVGEGGNLGFTQRGRVEYALAGGRINTDFIDNSAGVNTSDVEVNIKILLNPLMIQGRLSYAERNRLLARQTPEVAALVLRNNYLQSQAISTLELQSAARLPEFQHLIRVLERSHELNRALEYLPSDDELGERRKRGVGLTRPELAILLSYSKISLNNHLLASDVPEDPYLSRELTRYFPAPIQKRFARAIGRHRLRREIIATATTNSLVNRMGPTFVSRVQEDSGAQPAQVARAYTAAREIFAMRGVWQHIEKLDNRVPAKLQYEAAFQTSRLLRHATYWLLAARSHRLQVDAAVREFRGGVQELEAHIADVLTGTERTRYEHASARYLKDGLPAPLAARVASLEALNAALDIVGVAATHRCGVTETARVYFEIGTRTGIDWLRERIEKLAVDGTWQAVARGALRDSALRVHRRLAERVLNRQRRGNAQERVAAWLAAAGEPLAHWQRTLTDMRSTGAADFATLSVGVDAVHKLAG